MKLLAFSRLRVAAAALVLGLIASAGLTTVVSAAEPPVIVVINQAEIFRKSLAGQDERQQLTKIQEAIAADQKKEMEELKTEVDNLLQQKALLPADQFKEKQVQLAQKQKFIEYKYEQEFTVTSDQAEKKLLAQLYPILQEIMQERNATLLLEQGTIIMAATEYDITEEAIKRLDARSPKIKLERVLFKDLVEATQERMKKMQEAQEKANKK